MVNKHIAAGESHLQAGNLNDAMQCFELALELAPDHHRGIYLSALTHLKLGQEATALVQFNRALELSPNNPNYLSDLAVTKLRTGDKDGAMRDLDRCVQLDPNYGFRYALRAFARSSMGDVQGAIDDYKRAIELDPEDAISYNNLGMAEEQMGYVDSSKLRFAMADGLSAKETVPKDHTIPFHQEKSRPIVAEVEAAATELVPSETYWTTISKVFTDKTQRQEFLQFAAGLLKKDAK